MPTDVAEQKYTTYTSNFNRKKFFKNERNFCKPILRLPRNRLH